jgi:hypothetical protein
VADAGDPLREELFEVPDLDAIVDVGVAFQMGAMVVPQEIAD